MYKLCFFSVKKAVKTLQVISVSLHSSAYLLSVEFTEWSSELHFCSPSEMEMELIKSGVPPFLSCTSSLNHCVFSHSCGARLRLREAAGEAERRRGQICLEEESSTLYC